MDEYPDQVSVWPGFVDALSAVLVMMLFAVLVFCLASTYLSAILQTKDQNLIQMQGKLKLLQQEVIQSQNAQEVVLAREKVQALEMDMMVKTIDTLKTDLETQVRVHQEKDAQITGLQDKLRQISEQKLRELESYRSEFLAQLQAALGTRNDVRVVGDRFVFQAEVLFSVGSDKLEARGKETLTYLVRSLKEISAKIPRNVSWVLRVDGHTDSQPIRTHRFPSNWELSVSRAISVIQFLIQNGIRPENLAAAGFGEFQPLDSQGSPQALARNRRIELKLDQR